MYSVKSGGVSNDWAWMNMTDKIQSSSGFTIDESEIVRMKELRAWWNKGVGSESNGPGQGESGVAPAILHAPKSMLLKDVQHRKFFDATVKVSSSGGVKLMARS